MEVGLIEWLSDTAEPVDSRVSRASAHVTDDAHF